MVNFINSFCLHTDNNLAILSQHTFDTQSIHIFGLVYYLSTAQISPFYVGCYSYGNQNFANDYK